MVVTEFPIVADVKPEQCEKADSPMLITELGILIYVKFVQS